MYEYSRHLKVGVIKMIWSVCNWFIDSMFLFSFKNLTEELLQIT